MTRALLLLLALAVAGCSAEPDGSAAQARRVCLGCHDEATGFINYNATRSSCPAVGFWHLVYPWAPGNLFGVREARERGEE